MEPAPTRTPTVTNRFWMVAWWLMAGLFPAVFAIWRLGLHQTGWLVPAVHDGDGLMMLQWIDSMAQGHGFIIDPRLGYPGTQDLSAFPRADWLHLGALWALAKAGCSPALAYNIYLVAGFSFCSWSAALFWYLAGSPLPRSVALGILFALLPGHFQQIHHLFLAGYFLIPWQLAPGYRLAKGEGLGRWIPTWDECLFALLGGLAGLYYAWFAAVVVVVSGLRAGWIARSAKPFSQVAILSLLAGLAAGSGSLPSMFAKGDSARNPAVGARMALEAETYSLQPLALALPPQGHLSGLGLFRAEYMGPHRPLHEAEAGYLGIAAVGGLLMALLALVLAPRQHPWEALGLLALVAFTYAITGGMGALVAWLVPGIRVLGRMSFLLAFVGLSAWAFWPKTTLQGWRGCLALAALLLVGTLDQITKPDSASPAKRMEEWSALAELGHTLQTAYPQGGRHFQLPWQGYPEGASPGTMDGYAHLAGVIHAPNQTFSAGGLMNTRADAWQRWAASLPVPSLLATLRQNGFDGLWLDTRGYSPEALTTLRQELARHLPSPVGPLANRLWYDLRPAQNLPPPTPASPLLILRQGLLLDPLAQPARLSFRMRGSGEVRIHNPGPAGTYEIMLKAEEGATLPGGLTLAGPLEETVPFGPDHKLEKTIRVNLASESSTDLTFRTTRRWLRPAPMPLHDAAIWLEIKPVQ